MKNSEFKKLLLSAENPKWFNSKEFNLHFNIGDYKLNFKGFNALHKYLENQENDFNALQNLKREFNHSLSFFKNTKYDLEVFLQQNLHINDDVSLKMNFRDMDSRIISRIKDVLQFHSSETKFLLEIQNNFPESFESAFKYVVNETQNVNLNHRQNFIGFVLAYNFFEKEYNGTDRKQVEKGIVNKLKSDLQNTISTFDSELITKLKDGEDLYQDYVKKIDDFKNDKEKLYADWFINAKGSFEDFDNSSKKRIAELEELYEKKLKLQKPAEYWEKRGIELKNQGWKYLGTLVILVLIIVCSLGKILWEAPENIYNSFFDGDKSAAIRWSIVYITFISFMAFAIKAITKVMFSSFHLARDCEERYTLTYFYLSLSNETTIDTEEKKLVMQSLFSRAETGLLKDDGAPTMPNDLVSKFYNK